MPHTPPAAPKPFTVAEMHVVVDRVEVALSTMTWKDTPEKPASPLLQAFDGMTASDGGWTAMLCVYEIDGFLRYDGMATCLSEGLIVRLTPELALVAASAAGLTPAERRA